MVNKGIYLVLIAFLTTVVSLAQEVEWPDSRDNEVLSALYNTGSNSTYFLQSGTLTYDNQLVTTSEYLLGAFYLNDSQQLTCAGALLYSNSALQFSIAGDDATTPNKDGFSSGEQITWLALDTQTNKTLEVNVAFSAGSNSWVTNGFNVFSSISIIPLLSGCTDELACNYNSEAEQDDGSCTFADQEACKDCDGILIDSDSNGVSDCDQVDGCTDVNACNFVAGATTDDGSCSFAADGFDCDGNCLDQDVDGVCDKDEILGCQNSLFLEFDSLVTEDNGSCQTLIVMGCKSDFSFNYNPMANVDDGSCINEISLRFEPDSTEDVVSFNFLNLDLLLGDDSLKLGDVVGGFYEKSGQIVCAGFESFNGMDLSVPLFVDDVSTNDTTEGYIMGDEIYWIVQQKSSKLTYLLDVTYQEGFASNISNVALSDTRIGCTDSNAFNYNPNASIFDNSCVAVVEGCTDESACNYDSDVNTDDGLCYYESSATFNLNYFSEDTLFTIDKSPTLNNLTYSWTHNTVTLDESSDNYKPKTGGSYVVLANDLYGCSFSSSYFLEFVDIDELELRNAFRIFPNPINDAQFNVVSDMDPIEYIQIYDLNGKKLLHEEVSAIRKQVSLTEFSRGIYFVKIFTEVNSILKVIVVK